MNSPNELIYEKLEPKYCEGCGALRFRPTGSAEIYCNSCRTKMSEMAKAANPSDERCA